jgi:four helix bundle protein
MEPTGYLKLKDIEAYRIAFHLSNRVWQLVFKWDNFARDTVGKQFVRAVDSISANLAEGFGSFGKANRIRFYRYALGSVKEGMDWNQKAKVRQLLTEADYQEFFLELQKLPKAINSLIKFTRERLAE